MMKNLYEKYGLKKVINASGKMTALGVSKYNEKAIEAQVFGGINFFEMDSLFIKTGKYLADLVGAEDSQIVSSASAGIAQSVAALIGKGSEHHLDNPYSTSFFNREIILPKGHNVDYGAPVQTMVEVGGGEVVEAGYANICTPKHVENLIREASVAILYVKSHHTVQKSMLTIEEAVEISNKYKLPLILDAAAEEDLKKYLKLGVDIVIYSGAKALEGTSSGIVFGKKEYIEWIRLQSKGIGRAMKIGKENVLGLAAAIEDYLGNGNESGDSMKERIKPFIRKLNQIPTVKATLVKDIAGREIYRAKVTITDELGMKTKEVVEQLKENSPAIYVREHQVNSGILEFDIRSVNEKEMSIIIDSLKNIVSE